MDTFKNKKVSLVLLITSILMLTFGIFTKDHNNFYLRKKKITPPLRDYIVDLFGIEIPFKSYLLFFTIILGLGIYLFFFRSNFIQNISRSFAKLKSAYLGFEKKNIATIETKEQSHHNTRTKTIATAITLLALCITLYAAIEIGYSIWFFIVLPYYYLITLKPKSLRELILKAIFYPLIFVIILLAYTNNEFYGLYYNLSRFLVQYLVAVSLIFFTHFKRLDQEYEFSLKHPLFWTALICSITATISLIVNL